MKYSFFILLFLNLTAAAQGSVQFTIAGKMLSPSNVNLDRRFVKGLTKVSIHQINEHHGN